MLRNITDVSPWECCLPPPHTATQPNSWQNTLPNDTTATRRFPSLQLDPTIKNNCYLPACYARQWRVCRLCLLQAVMENYPKNKKALYDDMGVEDDKAAGVDFENF